MKSLAEVQLVEDVEEEDEARDINGSGAQESRKSSWSTVSKSWVVR